MAASPLWKADVKTHPLILDLLLIYTFTFHSKFNQIKTMRFLLLPFSEQNHCLLAKHSQGLVSGQCRKKKASTLAEWFNSFDL